MKTITICLLISMTLVFTQCRKERVVGPISEPIACFTVSSDSLNVGDSLVLTNCSSADEVEIIFPMEGQGNSQLVENFDEKGKYIVIYNEPGEYRIGVQATNFDCSGRVTDFNSSQITFKRVWADETIVVQ